MFDALKDEMLIRGYSRMTKKAYLFYNIDFLKFIGKRPHETTKEDVKAYIRYMVINGKKPSSVNLAINALKFYYNEVCGKRLFNKIRRMKNKPKLKPVLTKDEIIKMIEATYNVKHRLLIGFLYSAGLRVSECVRLKFSDLFLKENIGIVKNGKGNKDRYFLISKVLINDLKEFYFLNNKNKNDYIFKNRFENHISVRTAEMIVKDAAKKASINKNVFPHLLRASFATHLIEDGIAIGDVQKLLGHSRITTTMGYIRKSHKALHKIQSPLDRIYLRPLRCVSNSFIN